MEWTIYVSPGIGYHFNFSNLKLGSLLINFFGILPAQVIANNRCRQSFIGKSAVFNRLARYEEAVACATEAINLHRGNFPLPKAYYRRGFALYHLERFEEAIRDLEEAVRLAPASGDARNILHDARNRFRQQAQQDSNQDPA